MGSYAAFVESKMDEYRKHCGDLTAERDALRARAETAEAALVKFRTFAKAHEQWEANVLNDGPSWVDEMIGDDEFHEVQELRNLALET